MADPNSGNIEEVLAERGKQYGDFTDHGRITQLLKDVMRGEAGWNRLSPHQREALEMTAHKIGRILGGNPAYPDSWIDIEGYIHLVVQRLTR